MGLSPKTTRGRFPLTSQNRTHRSPLEGWHSETGTGCLSQNPAGHSRERHLSKHRTIYQG